MEPANSVNRRKRLITLALIYNTDGSRIGYDWYFTTNFERSLNPPC